jgi:polysaccharide export outer membrane protein
MNDMKRSGLLAVAMSRRAAAGIHRFKMRRIAAVGLAAGTLLGGVVSLCLYAAEPAATPDRTSTPTRLDLAETERTCPSQGSALADAHNVQLCQWLSPASPHPIWGVDSLAVPGCEQTWDHAGYIDWQSYAQGEYVGHFRAPHVPEYRYRVDDQIDFRFRRSRDQTNRPYRLQVGDVISVISATDQQIGDAQPQELPGVQAGGRISQPQAVIQPDGTIILPLINEPIPAAGRTITDLRSALEERYQEFYRVPAITVTPVVTNTKLQDILDSVDARFGQGGQRLLVTVSPDGTVQLPGLGSVFVQGLTDDELKREVDERYATIVDGIEVTPVLAARAPRYIYVVGEVGLPGQFALTGPTTVTMAIAMAGGYNGLNANMRQVVVLRRGDDWRLMATMLDIQGGLYGKRPCPADEIFLNDSDIVVVPKTPLRITNEWIEQVFIRGIYGVFPLEFSSVTSL